MSNEFESEDNGGLDDQKCLDIYPPLHVYTLPWLLNKRESLKINGLIIYLCLVEMGRSSGGIMEDIGGYEVWTLNKSCSLSEVQLSSSRKCITCIQSLLPHFYLIILL